MKKLRSNTFLRALCLVSLCIFLTPVAYSADNVCKSVPNEDPLVKGRSTRVTFPDGRVITVVGHFHGERQIWDIINLIDAKRFQSLTDSQFNDLLKYIEQENSKVVNIPGSKQNQDERLASIKSLTGFDFSNLAPSMENRDMPRVSVMSHAKKDLSYVISNINLNKDLGFISYESSQQNWYQDFPKFINARKVVLEEYERRKSKDLINFKKEEIEDLILSASNGNVYAYMVDPSLNNRVPMVGAEDQIAGMTAAKEDSIEKMEIATREMTRVDNLYWSSKSQKEMDEYMADKKNLYFGALLGFVKSLVLQMIMPTMDYFYSVCDQLRNTAPPWLRDSLELQIKAMETRIKLNSARDFKSAENLVKQRKTGIHFVGLNHFGNTVRYLEILCEQEKSALKPN